MTAPCSAHARLAQTPRRRLLLSLAATLPLAACAPFRPAPQAGSQLRTGRLSLSVQSVPAQNFSAGFELQGSAERGELLLTSVIGTTLGRARWAPGQAELLAGSQHHRFKSMEALLEAMTGAALPLAALFDWLAGQASQVAGWDADLSGHAQGRLLARRTSPQPEVQLRVLLDP